MATQTREPGINYRFAICDGFRVDLVQIGYLGDLRWGSSLDLKHTTGGRFDFQAEGRVRADSLIVRQLDQDFGERTR